MNQMLDMPFIIGAEVVPEPGDLATNLDTLTARICAASLAATGKAPVFEVYLPQDAEGDGG